MRFFTTITLAVIAIHASFAQAGVPEFNWVEQEISEGNNIKAMTVAGTDTAVLVGYGRTFKRTVDAGQAWQDVGMLREDYDFIDMSIKGNVGYIVSVANKIIDNPSTGEDDVYANAVLLKTSDGGNTWINLSLDSIGTGTDRALNPSLPGAYKKYFYSVECVNDTVALLGAQWKDVSTGTEVQHGAAFITYNGGKKWEAISSDPGVAPMSMGAVADTFFIGGNKFLYKGIIGEASLTDIYANLDADGSKKAYIADIEFYNNSELLVSTSVDSVYYSTDMGASFTAYTCTNGSNDVLKYNDNVIVILGSSSKSYATTDGGATWSICSPNATVYEIGGIVNDSLIALGKGAIYKLAINDLTAGNFSSWVTQEVNIGNNNQKMFISDDESLAIVIGYGEGIKISADKGLTWSDAVNIPELMSDEELIFDFNGLSKGSGTTQFACARRFKFADYDSGFDGYYSGIIVVSEDNWETYTYIDNTALGSDTPDDVSKCPTATGCYALDSYTVECLNDSVAYVYVDWYDTVTVASENTSHSRVFKTMDKGASWTAISDDFGSKFVYAIDCSTDDLFILGYGMFFMSTDAGATFTDLYPAVIETNDATDTIMQPQSIRFASENTWYIPTTADGLLTTNDRGISFSKVSGISGANDIAILDTNSFMLLGSTAKTLFTNDGGEEWETCTPGAVIWSQQGIWNDSLYAMAKGSVYKIAIADLEIDYTEPTTNITTVTDMLNLYYTNTGVVVESVDANIATYNLYSVTGNKLRANSVNANSFSIKSNMYKPGVYVLEVETSSGKTYYKIFL